MPSFVIVGLADKTIAESKERVRAAIASLGLALPAKKILINLAPADLIKEGSHFDLPIALGILTSIGILPQDEMRDYLTLGELSLDGTILSVSGVLPAAVGANALDKGLICSKLNGKEAAWSGNANIIAPENLLQLINHFKGVSCITPPNPEIDESEASYQDLKDIKGQRAAKRVLEIAAAGGHNLLMFGPPGTGKSMLAQRLPGIMPTLSAKEMLECSAISSLAGNIKEGRLIRSRPFRAPHHSCTGAAMIGGGAGRRVRPGEISLAHNGVLFLDELPEFSGAVIEALRQPIETGEVLISRSGAHVKYPAAFQLVAAMNPCKCGYLSDPRKACSRAPACGNNYKAKISGPILDRFDLHIELGYEEEYPYTAAGSFATKEETTAEVAARVLYIRELQLKRYEGYGIRTNSELEGNLLSDYAVPDNEGLEMLNASAKKFRLSMRAYNRVLKVARTIADLNGSQKVYKIHIAEALTYRQSEFIDVRAA